MYRQPQDASAGGAQQYQFSAGPSPYGYSPFTNNMTGMLPPGIHSSPQHLSPRPVMPRPTSHNRHASIESQGAMRAPSRSLSPGLGNATPSRTVPYTPTDRSLPSKDVSPETITDAYVDFILYCNPNFPLDVDTSTLKSTFQSPPKSDQKDFEIYRLFELIQKFDAKEIKTWGQLALDLGVEAPDTSKGQSTQKVQQYTVRLKRWMRAMHVDAFFEYLLGKDHAYFTDIPHPNEPFPPRDNVVAEEDLAIRALDPAFRPKRGRRRNSDTEQDEGDGGSINKYPRLMDDTPNDPNSAQPGLMMPFSARTDTALDPWAVASAVTPQTFAPWSSKRGVPHSAMTSAGPSQLRWQIHGSDQNPITPHPLSAHPSTMADHLDSAFDNEPKSAVTPSTRKRRRHGPAVSSAWPSANGSSAKPRGRPPANRSAQDGPFGTFPVDPGNDKATSVSFAAPVAKMEHAYVAEESPVIPLSASSAKGSDHMGRQRLSLQVPARAGGPVRLATPPTVLVNGETNNTEEAAVQAGASQGTAPIQNARLQQSQKPVLTVEREIPGFAFEVLKRVLASSLLRADLTGRSRRLSGDEAKRLADAVLARFNIPREDTDLPRDDIARLTVASWLGVGEQLNVPLGPAIGQNKRITVTRFRTDEDGYEEFATADDDDTDQIRDVFDLSWTVTMGGCNGQFEIKGLSLADPAAEDPDIHDKILDAWYDTAQRVGVGEFDMDRLKRKYGDSHAVDHTGQPILDSFRNPKEQDIVDWKAKYRALEFGFKMAKGEFDRFRHRAIEKVLDALI